MKLIGKKILVELIEAPTTTPAGIIIPLSQRVENEGIVKVVGPDVSPEIQPGNKVRYYAGFGIPMEVEGKKCLFLKEDELELVL